MLAFQVCFRARARQNHRYVPDDDRCALLKANMPTLFLSGSVSDIRAHKQLKYPCRVW